MKEQDSSKILIVSGPAGVGKTTIIAQLTSQDARFEKVITHTTREARPDEKEGHSYFFSSKQKFKEMSTRGEFVDEVALYGEHYGLAIESISHASRRGIPVIALDPGGALRVAKRLPNVVTVFLRAENQAVLRERLLHRSENFIDQATINQRLHMANDDMSKMTSFDYIITNVDIAQSVKELVSLFFSEPLFDNE